MGSFSYTCSISGLPIDDGHWVRYLLLTKNPYFTHSNSICEPTSEWFPRTFPLRGYYNDYGQVKVEDHDELGSQLWLSSFDSDLIEKPTGKNTYHDVSVSKGMSFSDLQYALTEGRVEVKVNTGVGVQTLPVSQVMIREDVWNKLLTLRTETTDAYELNLAQIETSGRRVWDEPDLENPYVRQKFAYDNERRFVIEYVAPIGGGLASAFLAAYKRKSGLSADKVERFLRSAAELIYIQGMLYDIRYAWRPSYSCGTQTGDWGAAYEWHKRLSDISKEIHDRSC